MGALLGMVPARGVVGPGAAPWGQQPLVGMEQELEGTPGICCVLGWGPTPLLHLHTAELRLVFLQTLRVLFENA